MPLEEYNWLPKAEMLRYEEIARLTRAFAANGVNRIRLTGGEPSLRRNLPWLVEQLATAKPCEAGVDTRELPADCRESAETPRALFEKLEQAGHDTLVIPHGLAWGQHAPPGASLATQLAPGPAPQQGQGAGRVALQRQHAGPRGGAHQR